MLFWMYLFLPPTKIIPDEHTELYIETNATSLTSLNFTRSENVLQFITLRGQWVHSTPTFNMITPFM